MLVLFPRAYPSAVSPRGAVPRWLIWSALGLAALVVVVVQRASISAGGNAGPGGLEIHLEPVPPPAEHDILLGFAKPMTTFPTPASRQVPARRRKSIQMDPVPAWVARESVEPKIARQTEMTASTEMPVPVERKIEFTTPLAFNSQPKLEFASPRSPLRTVPTPGESPSSEPTTVDSTPVGTTKPTQAPSPRVAPIQASPRTVATVPTPLLDPQRAPVAPASTGDAISPGNSADVTPSWVHPQAKPIEKPPTFFLPKPVKFEPLLASPLKGSHPIPPIQSTADWTEPNATPADIIITKGPLKVDQWIDSTPIDPIPAIDYESPLPVPDVDSLLPDLTSLEPPAPVFLDVASLGPPAPVFQESEWIPGPPLFAHNDEHAESISLIPEPSTGLLLAAGLVLLGAAKRRR